MPSPKSINKEKAPVMLLNESEFNNISRLLGQRFREVILRHLEVSIGQIHTIRELVEKESFAAISDIAHPLKSASQQIGASAVAVLAEAIEHMSRDGNTDKASYQKLVDELRSAQKATDEIIRRQVA